MEEIVSIANLGGLGAFSAVVYLELRRLRETLEKFSDKVVRIEISGEDND